MGFISYGIKKCLCLVEEKKGKKFFFLYGYVLKESVKQSVSLISNIFLNSERVRSCAN